VPPPEATDFFVPVPEEPPENPIQSIPVSLICDEQIKEEFVSEQSEQSDASQNEPEFKTVRKVGSSKFNDRYYACDTCGQKFQRKYNMQIHQRKHVRFLIESLKFSLILSIL
jgi:hypothetical protein